jgi:tungstate transport system permease protein
LGRGLAEVGAVSMVGGAIAYKTNVMTTAIMMYTNQGDFKMAIALGVILIAMFLIMNIVVYCFQARVSR